MAPDAGALNVTLTADVSRAWDTVAVALWRVRAHQDAERIAARVRRDIAAAFRWYGGPWPYGPEPGVVPGDALPHTCPRCGSPRWLSVSLNGGYTRVAQCVPCGAYGDVLGPGWKA